LSPSSKGILAVGNHLNGGTYRGQARGFRLETLLRLTDVKAVDRKTSLLHFVVKELQKTSPGVEFLSTELESVKLAASLHLDGTKEALGQIVSGLKQVNDEVLKAAGADPEQDTETSTEETHDRFRDVMIPFADSADAHVVDAKRLATSADDAMKGVTEFFGEPFKADNAGRIFRLVADFLVTFDKVQTDMKTAAEREAAAKRREESLKMRKSKSVALLKKDGAPGSATDTPSDSPPGARSKPRAPGGEPIDLVAAMHNELKAKAPRHESEESPGSKMRRMKELGLTSTSQLLEYDAASPATKKALTVNTKSKSPRGSHRKSSSVEGLPTVAEGGTPTSTPRKGVTDGKSLSGRDSPTSPFRSPKEGREGTAEPVQGRGHGEGPGAGRAVGRRSRRSRREGRRAGRGHRRAAFECDASRRWWSPAAASPASTGAAADGGTPASASCGGWTPAASSTTAAGNDFHGSAATSSSGSEGWRPAASAAAAAAWDDFHGSAAATAATGSQGWRPATSAAASSARDDFHGSAAAAAATGGSRGWWSPASSSFAPSGIIKHGSAAPTTASADREEEERTGTRSECPRGGAQEETTEIDLEL
jgi:hypothetical protein